MPLNNEGRKQAGQDGVDRNIINVCSCGATGNGQTKDTNFLQKAIDECGRAGGGTVYFPPGTYLSGTLRLCSNVTLYLDRGAVLLASPKLEDYEIISAPTSLFPGRRYFLYGENLTGISIEGHGVIDGQGPAFWWKNGKYFSFIGYPPTGILRPKKERPSAMILFVNCCDLLFRDVTLRNSPRFTLWLIGCQRAVIDGITILNPRNGPNTDGIDVDCCRYIRINNCHIDAGDDCIALKNDSNWLGEKRPCEHVVVANCTLASTACAVRIGFEGDAPIRNCIFSNISIIEAHHGLDMIVRASKEGGAAIENIVFANIVMQNVNKAIYFWLGVLEENGPLRGNIEHISVSNVLAMSRSSSFVGGLPGTPVRGVYLDNIRLLMQSDTRQTTSYTMPPGVWGSGQQYPCAVYFRHVSDLALHAVDISWERKPHGMHAFCFDHVRDVTMEGVREQTSPGELMKTVSISRSAVSSRVLL